MVRQKPKTARSDHPPPAQPPSLWTNLAPDHQRQLAHHLADLIRQVRTQPGVCQEKPHDYQ
jgi:hypothetical protein